MDNLAHILCSVESGGFGAFCWAFQAIANGKCNQDSENNGLSVQKMKKCELHADKVNE